MPTVTGAVEKIESASRNTKRGPANVYYVWVNGTKYSLGFKYFNAPVGTIVSFDAAENPPYGWEAKTFPMAAGGGGTTPIAAGASRPSYTPSGGKGVFPIPLLDGQRSIVRQNALTNARELYTSNCVDTGPTTIPAEEAADRIVEIARIFESYTAGDIEARQAEQELKSATIT